MTQAFVRRADLSPEERRVRKQLESHIHRALRYHLKAAEALREIRDRRLYRDEYVNFEDYCVARWHIARSHANRLCDWAEVAHNLSPIGDKLRPVRESHARPLARLTVGQQRTAWKRLVSMPRHTERLIEQVCEDVRTRPVNGRGPSAIFVNPDGHDALSTPLPWFGGKAKLADKIVALLPRHELYLEPFLGGGAVFFSKPPSKLEIINDINGDVVNLFRVLRNREHAAELQRLLKLTPHSREEHDWCRQHPEDKNNVERARRFYVRVRQSYSCEEDGAWARTLNPDRSRVAEWRSSVDKLHLFAERLCQAQIECLDFRRLIAECDQRRAVIYADPPYEPNTRSRNGFPYRHELLAEDHVELLDILNGLKRARVVLSGYESPLYAKQLKRWKRYEFRRVVPSSVT